MQDVALVQIALIYDSDGIFRWLCYLVSIQEEREDVLPLGFGIVSVNGRKLS